MSAVNVSSSFLEKSSRQELAPNRGRWLPRGCRGVVGPVPQPLLIKTTVFGCPGRTIPESSRRRQVPKSTYADAAIYRHPSSTAGPPADDRDPCLTLNQR